MMKIEDHRMTCLATNNALPSQVMHRCCLHPVAP
jgi:hypothetical protein